MLSLLLGSVILLYRTYYLYVFVDFVCLNLSVTGIYTLISNFLPSRNRYFVTSDFKAVFYAKFDCTVYSYVPNFVFLDIINKYYDHKF
jgi:hypothetical protein